MGNIIKAKMELYGISRDDIADYLEKQHGMTVGVGEISRAISGSGKFPVHDRIKTRVEEFLAEKEKEQKFRMTIERLEEE